MAVFIPGVWSGIKYDLQSHFFYGNFWPLCRVPKIQGNLLYMMNKG